MPPRARIPRFVHILAAEIRDESSFHSVFARSFGFPAFYGKNMDAWIDCMSDLRSDTGMTNIRLAADETLVLELSGYEELSETCPAIADALVLCIAAVNCRFIDHSEPPAILLLPC